MRRSQFLVLSLALFLPLIAGGCRLFNDDWEDDYYECGHPTTEAIFPAQWDPKLGIHVT